MEGGELLLELNLSKLGNPTVDIGYEIRLEGVADPVPSVRFAASSGEALESSGSATITVERSGELGESSVVRVRSNGGTATAGEDYAPVDQDLTFGPGSSSASFEVAIVDDTERESDETIVLTLSDPTGAVLGSRRQTTLSIQDDDSVSTLGFVSLSTVASEAAGSVALEVERAGASSGAVSLSYEVSSLSATAGVDYEVAATGTLEWDDQETGSKAIPVTLFDDLLDEGSELVRFELISASGEARVGGITVAVLVIADDEASAACTASERALCLQDGRFRVEVDWLSLMQGSKGTGSADPDSSQSGFFWFFDPENIELIVKILDGRAFTGAYWLFYGGLSDVEYWVTAADLETGITRVYRNEEGSLRGVGDVGAFPQDPAGRRRVDRESSSIEGSLDSYGRASVERRQVRSEHTCVSGPETLCLVDGRFQVEVTWSVSASDEQGTGAAVPRTDQSGLFWFFASQNIELVVKVLDGRVLNDHFWVFYGALSDVGYTITVTDTETGEVRVYTNPEGSIEGGADTAAF